MLLVGHFFYVISSPRSHYPPSRVLAFSNALRLGICFTSKKERFILEGDLSGRFVHPWFTRFMAVMGVHLHQESRHQWAELRIQVTLTQILLKMVLGMIETELPINTFQAFYLMAMACTYTHTLVPGRRYLERCQKMIKMEGFGLVDPTWIEASARESPPAIVNDRPSPYTEEKHELVSVLVNLMYLQCIHCIMYDKCHGLYEDIERQLPDFEVRCPLVTLGQIVKHHFIARLPRDFRTLSDGAQSPHCYFGSGCVFAYRQASATRFVRLPPKVPSSSVLTQRVQIPRKKSG